jgi:hypothetical protein
MTNSKMEKDLAEQNAFCKKMPDFDEFMLEDDALLTFPLSVLLN